MAGQGVMPTYDDAQLSTNYTDVAPSDPSISLASAFSKRITLNMPIVGPPMDTVTESAMAIALAEAGGIGVIQRRLSPKAIETEAKISVQVISVGQDSDDTIIR